MKKIAVVTDSNSGITQSMAKELGIAVLPMPFEINGDDYFEDINLTQEQFYEKLAQDAEVSTSQPAPGQVLDLWEALLKDYDEIVNIPMSSALSSSCASAMMLSEDYDGRVVVVDNKRISHTQKWAALDAKRMADSGRYTAAQIKEILEETAADQSIYIMVDTLKYLKKGGRVTPAAAAIGTLLKIKPVLKIQGGKLDAFAKVRTVKQAKQTMIAAIKKDFVEMLHDDEQGSHCRIDVTYTPGNDYEGFLEEVKEAFPGHEIGLLPLSLSVACHIGFGALAITCTKEITANED